MSGIFTVRDVMTKNVKAVGRGTNMQSVIDMMIQFDISSVVIVQKEKPVGIITHKDILLKIVQPNMFYPRVFTAGQVMSMPVITINQNASLEESARLMAQKGIKKLPVVDGEKLVGLVTSMDLVREHPRIIELVEEIYGARIYGSREYII